MQSCLDVGVGVCVWVRFAGAIFNLFLFPWPVNSLCSQSVTTSLQFEHFHWLCHIHKNNNNPSEWCPVPSDYAESHRVDHHVTSIISQSLLCLKCSMYTCVCWEFIVLFFSINILFHWFWQRPKTDTKYAVNF